MVHKPTSSTITTIFVILTHAFPQSFKDTKIKYTCNVVKVGEDSEIIMITLPVAELYGIY